MFKLYYDYKKKGNGRIVKIYSVSSDKCGYPRFLIHLDNQWIWKSAKHFKPIEKEKI